MEKPVCFVQKDRELVVCKLYKSIYALKQYSSHLYYKFHDLGFHILDEDECVYTKKSGQHLCL